MSYLTGSRRLVRGHHKERSMTSIILDRIEIQLDAGSDEVTLTREDAVEVATRLHRQAAEPGAAA